MFAFAISSVMLTVTGVSSDTVTLRLSLRKRSCTTLACIGWEKERRSSNYVKLLPDAEILSCLVDVPDLDIRIRHNRTALISNDAGHCARGRGLRAQLICEANR
jgi:hypothetical protein